MARCGEKYSSPNCSWAGEVPFFIHGCVQICEWAHSLSQEATPHISDLRMFWCWHNKGLMVLRLWPFVLRASFFFWMPQIMGKGINQRKSLYPQQSSPCIFCRTSVCPWCFSWGEVLFAALLDTRPSSKSLHLTLHADALTPACYHSWASFVLVVPWSSTESTLGDGPGLFLGALKPSSQQLNLSLWSSWSDKWLI